MKGPEYVDIKGIYTKDIAGNKTYKGGKFVSGIHFTPEVYNPFSDQYDPNAMRMHIHREKFLSAMGAREINASIQKAAKDPKRYRYAMKYARGEITLKEFREYCRKNILGKGEER